jgi:energy coupling factor transporter S component ThiW
MFGPILGGLLYRRFHSFRAVFVGEVIGTGVISAIAVYPLMKLFYGLDVQCWYYYIPFYTPSAVMGAAMGVATLLILKRSGVLYRMKDMLER